MFRKFFLSAVTAVTLLAPLSLTTAQANDHRAEPRHEEPRRDERRHEDHIFAVYYRTNPRSPWVFYHNYNNRHEANLAAADLHAFGYEAFVR